MSFSATAALTNASAWVLAQGPPENPVGPEFGKASPIGMLIIVALAVLILGLGYAFHRRLSRFKRRQLFAEAHDLDPFDTKALDIAMMEAGVLDRRRIGFL